MDDGSGNGSNVTLTEVRRGACREKVEEVNIFIVLRSFLSVDDAAPLSSRCSNKGAGPRKPASENLHMESKAP